jgi:hypothetical protein
MVRRIGVTLAAIVPALFTVATAVAAQSQPAQDGFVPVTGVPASEQIPAAPLVVGAYAFFLLLMVFYLWTIWRRIGKVEADMRALERRQGASAGGHGR